jgi:hypothetical protein
MLMRSALCWDITQCRMVFFTGVAGQCIGLIFKVQKYKKKKKASESYSVYIGQGVGGGWLYRARCGRWLVISMPHDIQSV